MIDDIETMDSRARVYVASIKVGWSHSVALKKSGILNVDLIEYLYRYADMNEVYHSYCDEKKVGRRRRTAIRLRDVKVSCTP